MRKNEMNAKKLLVSFLLIASVLFLATAVVSAAEITSGLDVKIDGVDASGDNIAVLAGDTISVKVVFTADVDSSDVRVKATLEGNNNNDVTAVTSKFDVVEDKTYIKYLTLKVPSDLDADEITELRNLNIEISGDDADDFDDDYTLNVQRDSYEFAIKSVTVDSSVDAGEKMSVEVVLKNVGYNNADDVYLSVSIPELNIEKSVYLGDIVTKHYKDSDDSDDDDTDTVSGKLYLDVPYNAQAGVYTLVVSAENDEVTNTAEKQITIENSISDIAIKSGNDLILLNPTNKLVVYTVKYNSNEATYAVSAGSSKSIAIESAEDTDVSVYSGTNLLSVVNFSGSNQASEMQLTNPVFVLTVILAVVFLVLLVVLVVLITKKPQKTEEFGESYY